MRRIQIHIDDELDRVAESEAARRGISKAALIRESLASSLRSRLPLEPNGDAWEEMCGWLDDEPVEDIDEAVYGPRR
jgi:ribbon-helix-helix CopG family protein